VPRRLLYPLALSLLGAAVLLAAAGVGEEPGKLSDWQALVLGVVQGMTELLPISSSGHLALVPWVADWSYLEENPAFNHTFDVALHLGTMLAVAGYFWRDIVDLTVAWVRSVRRRSITTPDEKVAWIVFVATLPAALVGLLFEDVIAEDLGQPWQIAILIAVFAVVLWLADRSPQLRTAPELGLWQGLGIGVAQSLALMPGVSRSGITITAGRFLRLDRDSAARLSFLLLVPAVFGAVVLKGIKDVVLGELRSGWQGPFVVGTIAAAGSGLLAIDWLLGYVRRHDYSVFVIYRLVLAAVIVVVILSGARAATS
jgi:undecaprenyl-diphosphatase